MTQEPIERAIQIAGGQTALARRSGARQQEIWNWSAGRPVPRDRCPAIERATDAQVTVEELCPDVTWARIPDPTWPHPEGRPCIDVAGPPPPATTGA
jgi:DNA-binding transcriptional regulator YdaS (Cro superfamily)